MRNKTLRLRLALWIAELLVLILAAFGTFVYLSLVQGLSAAMDDSLKLTAAQVISTMNDEDSGIDFMDLKSKYNIGTAELYEPDLTIRMLDPDGRTVISFGANSNLTVPSENLTDAFNLRLSYATVIDPVSHDPIRFIIVPVVTEGKLSGIIQIARSIVSIQETLNRLLTTLLLGGLLLVIIRKL